MKTYNLRILLVLSVLFVFGTMGSVLAASSDEIPTNLTFGQWTGESFTLLPLAADEQASGYGLFPTDQAEQGFEGDRSLRISYAEHVGKQVTISQVVTYPAGRYMNEAIVYMTVNDTGETLAGRTIRDQLEGLVLTSDVNNARQQFLNTVVYPKYRVLSAVSSTGTDAPIDLSIGSAVTVVDVITGVSTQKPICLIVSVNGQKAMLPIAYSYTNVSVNTWKKTVAWQDDLFTQNPKLTLGWSEDVWNNIEAGNVENGMTKGQIQLSWGRASDRESDDSAWIYGTKRLNFSGDVLTSIEAK